jgi:putative molybdopterin biosynthesis protein
MPKFKLRKRFSKSPQPPFTKGGRGGITLRAVPLMKRNIYLKKKTLEEAKRISSELANLIHLETETIPVVHSLGRVTAEPVFARISSPPFHCAAMDGIAVKAETTYGTTDESP